MAASQRIYSLDLGSQTVRLAEFRSDNRGGLILWDYRTSELLASPSTDGTRVSQTAVAVQELVGMVKAEKARVNYCIPAQSVFTRFVKLPSVGEEKVEQIIQFEAQQNVPFPIDEVVWDYQLVSADDTDRLEVVLVAIKADLLEELNDAVEGGGVRTGVVDVAPMALTNAFRYNYSEATGCSLLIDIGSRTTNLVFIEGKRVFSRTIPIGGNTITAAIAKDFDEPFTAAEERKKKQGFVSLGGAYAEPDDAELTRVSKMVRNTMTRLHAEISRSISFYRSQQGGSAPERVYLCGGAMAMPYMREFFHEKLALPIEFFNPLRNVAVGGSVDAEAIGRDAHLLGELVGLGLRSSSDCPMELNLRPSSVVKVQEMEARRPYFALAGLCLLLILGGWWYFFAQAASAEQAAYDSIKPRKDQLENFKNKMDGTRKQIAARQVEAKPLLAALEERDAWVKLIDDLNARLPNRYIWITSLRRGVGGKTVLGGPSAQQGGGAAPADAGTHLIVTGLYLANPDEGGVVDAFAKNLAESPFYKIDLSKKDQFNPIRQTQTDTGWTFEYELHLPLNQPLP